MALWLEDFADARVVAVTGTKGKSTTAALAAAILRHEGLEVALIGNIGVPVTETYDRPLADAYVVEISSYQAADATVAPGVCVLTSLAPDHLDWHRGVESYYRDKLHLIEVGPPGALAVARGERGGAASGPPATRTGPCSDRPAGCRRAMRGVIVIDGEPLGTTPGPGGYPVRHNVWNLCGAHRRSTAAGRPEARRSGAIGRRGGRIRRAAVRCRTVGERGGLTFVDDALASNPFATVSSLRRFSRPRGSTVILGGADRGVDTAGLVEALAAPRRPVPRVVVLTPDTARVGRFAGRGFGRGGIGPDSRTRPRP